MKKKSLVLFAALFVGMGFWVAEVNAACFDVTYPSLYCDAQGSGSCTRICCDTQQCPD